MFRKFGLPRVRAKINSQFEKGMNNNMNHLLTEKPRIPIKEILLYGFLPSFIKILIYRYKGYRIGKGVSFGMGSIIIGRDVVIGEDTHIGLLTIVRGSRIRIGDHVKIGTATFLDTPDLEIGDGTKINEQVFVGGLQFPDSRLTIGRNCQIMQMSFINPARSITIGDDTGIGGHSLIFGHTSWLSKFEGYPVKFEPIEIGNSVSVAWRVFILPGTKIGDGAVIGANSVVHRSVPPRSMAVGFPARVVSKHPDFPLQITSDDKVRFLKEIVEEMIQYLGGFGILCRPIAPDRYEMVGTRKKRFKKIREHGQLQVLYDPVDSAQTFDFAYPAIVLSLEVIPDKVRETIEYRGNMWIDIAGKERSHSGNIFGEEVVKYMGRYGVRFFRVK